MNLINGRNYFNEKSLEYLESLNVEQLTELQLKHAIRLSRYRGKETNYRTLTTA